MPAFSHAQTLGSLDGWEAEEAEEEDDTFKAYEGDEDAARAASSGAVRSARGGGARIRESTVNKVQSEAALKALGNEQAAGAERSAPIRDAPPVSSRSVVSTRSAVSGVSASTALASMTSTPSGRRTFSSSGSPRARNGGRPGEHKKPARWYFCCRSSRTLIRKAAQPCRSICKNKYFQGIMFIALLAALFLPDIWILANVRDNKDLDIVLTLVLVAFIFELLVQSIGLSRTYLGSFFFYMDLLGACSLLLDFSYLPLMDVFGSEDMSGNVVIMRAARIAKLGARAGRFTKLVKLLRFLPGMGEDPEAASESSAGTAKKIGARLTTTLSTRVSCLIIVMVMIMPLFSMWTYPELDRSMRGWMDTLDRTASTQPERLARRLERFGTFFGDKSYWPFALAAKHGAALPQAALEQLPWSHDRGGPVRSTNVLKIESSNLVCEFNFQQPRQIDSLMNLLLLTFIMALMVGFSLVLSNSVSVIVLRPLENLLHKIRRTASMIFKSVTDMESTMKAEEEEEESEDDGGGGDAALAFDQETKLLEKVVRKLRVLSEISARGSHADEAVVGLDDHDTAMIMGLSGVAQASSAAAWEAAGQGDDCESIAKIQREMVETAGLSYDLLHSWNFNPLELDKARNHAAAFYFVGGHNHGVPFGEVEMSHFLERCENGYGKSLPYHNWFHAIDTTHCLYRLLQICGASRYLSGLEHFAVLISAIAHDCGHPGFNNSYLIETSNHLALRYNDKSPLENMHSALMFEISGDKTSNVFSMVGRQHFKEARRVCIDAILWTDTAQHFALIKEVQMCAEMCSDVLEAARAEYRENHKSFPTADLVESFRLPECRKLLTKVFLRVSDISNSMRPFRICRIWAWQAVEELWLQGDSEKALGIPVQALNDRDKVNRAFSQIGFNEFLVSPLLFAVTKALPPMEAHTELMIQNVMNWQQSWIHESQPAPTENEMLAVEDRLRRIRQKFMDTCL